MWLNYVLEGVWDEKADGQTQWSEIRDYIYIYIYMLMTCNEML